MARIGHTRLYVTFITIKNSEITNRIFIFVASEGLETYYCSLQQESSYCILSMYTYMRQVRILLS